jgi:hypothetical protein
MSSLLLLRKRYLHRRGAEPGTEPGPAVPLLFELCRPSLNYAATVLFRTLFELRRTLFEMLHNILRLP